MLLANLTAGLLADQRSRMGTFQANVDVPNAVSRSPIQLRPDLIKLTSGLSMTPRCSWLTRSPVTSPVYAGLEGIKAMSMVAGASTRRNHLAESAQG